MRGLLALIPAVLFLWLTGCGDPEAEREAALAAALEEARALAGQAAAELPTESDGLVFRMFFDRSVDLDLYVTDPLDETVYFAKHDTATGGRLVRDVRCESPAEVGGVEEIRFDDPYPGKYRVGIDFPEGCNGPEPFAGFAVSVEGAGESHAAHGAVELQRFEVVVLEFELEGP
jgi:hypothetical protein